MPPDNNGEAGSGSIVDTPLAKYLRALEKLRGAMLDMQNKNPNVDARVLAVNLQDTAREADTLLQPFDDKAKAMLGPLLVNPLKVQGMRFPAGFGGRFR